ncbi:MAG: FIST C-terminal domain-containing protein [Gammaproteobacteria bacterium]|nr:FIST C-terminal domain-containing protein [Gammaproteobacteria bacterium]
MAIKSDTFSWSVDAGFVPQSLPLADSAGLVLLFASGDVASQWAKPIAAISAAYPNALVVGCSSAGEIRDTQVPDAGIVGIALQFASTELRAELVRLQGQDTAEAVTRLGRQLQSEGLRYVMVLADGLAINGSDLAATIQGVLPPDVLVTGGLAGDGDRFAQTAVFFNDEIVHDAMIAVGFYGDHIRLGHGSLGGWDSFGPMRKVTRSEGNVLYELDNQSALSLYKRYLGDYAKDLPASGLLFPLSLEAEQDGNELVRTLLAVDEEAQSLTFAGSLPEGSRARLMKANFDRLVDGAYGAAQQTMDRLQQPAEVALLISCVGRKMVLGDRIEEEVEAVREVLGPDARMIGFYSYGELSPVVQGRCELHNQTMTVTTFAEV